VRAGAGSGKTAVLARRFVHLLRPDGPVGEVSQILAITFTEKAAAEMTRKIREVIAEQLGAADAATRAHWARVRRDLLGAQISTIHAFSARVLRENPLEAGVDPRAIVLDEHESRTYVESAVEAALLAHLRAGDAAARELVLREGLAGGRSGGAVGLVADFLARLGRTGRDGAWLVAATARQAERAPEASRRRAGERVPRRSPRRGRPGRSGSDASDPRRRSRTSSRCARCAGCWPRRRSRAPWRRSSRCSRAGASWGRSPRRTACCTRCRRTSASPA